MDVNTENFKEEVNEEKEEEVDPQITSNNPTERILARRLRIQRRVEALRKQKQKKLIGDVSEDAIIESDEVKKSSVEQQIEKSGEVLETLIQEGNEYVTNVIVATEARETDRRETEGIRKEKLLKQLEDEANAAKDMFNEIAGRWDGISKYNDPLHISEDITFQKERCDELISQKDEIIATLREKLRKAERDFATDQKKQIEDVDSIAHRIENQIIAMRKAYREELQIIEDVTEAHRQVLINSNNKKWDELYNKRDEEEKSNAELRTKDYWDFDKQMDAVSSKFDEDYRSTVIQLENNCDELQRELESIKMDALKNSEKLDYNYQILKKREDENLIIKSQQKRRINKLQDVINSLRKKNNEYKSDTTQKIKKVTDEIKKLGKSILDVEQKADHMTEVNGLKFEKIWNLNKSRADKLFKRVLDIDRVLQEQQLGLYWQMPEIHLPGKMIMENFRPSYKQTDVNEEDSVDVLPSNGDENIVYKRIVKLVLTAIADKTGFLIEDHLHTILKPYLEYERTLVKIDNVFTAFNLKNKRDIDVLFQYFLPYTFCPLCSKTQEKAVVSDEESVVHIHDIDQVNLKDLAESDSNTKMRESSFFEMLKELAGIDRDQGGTLIEFGPLSVRIFDDSLKGECRGPDHLTIAGPKETIFSSSREVDQKVNVPCPLNHPLMISSVYVLKALKDFLAKYHPPQQSMPTMDIRLTQKKSTISRMITATDIETHWEKYLNLFPSDKIKLWDSLFEGLKKYHNLLKVRKLTSEEVMSLRKQNYDLRRLFANYIDKSDIPY